MPKILFFDLDNTLWDGNEHVPGSAVEAIAAARRRGHRFFPSTGRSRAAVHQKALFDLEPDGLVSGGGTRVELPGGGRTCVMEDTSLNECFNEPFLSADLIAWTVEEGRRYGVRFLLEGPEYMYMGKEDASDHWFFSSISARFGSTIRDINACWGAWEANKMTCELPDKERCAPFLEELEKRYQVIRHADTTIELEPKGMDKGHGVRQVCRILNVPIADTIAFGDSANDLGMLRAAGMAVVMGNGAEAVKAEADLVCPPLDEDGILRAFQTLKLI